MGGGETETEAEADHSGLAGGRACSLGAREVLIWHAVDSQGTLRAALAKFSSYRTHPAALWLAGSGWARGRQHYDKEVNYNSY